MTHAIMLRLYAACAIAALLGALLALTALRAPRSEAIGAPSMRARHAKLCLATVVPGGAWSAECLARIWLLRKYPDYSILTPIWAVAMLAIGVVFLASFRISALRNDGVIVLLARLASLVAWSLGLAVAAISAAYI